MLSLYLMNGGISNGTDKKIIKRLKATGMPIKEIKKYAALRAKGDACRQLIEFVSPAHSITELALGGNIERLLQI